MKKKHIKYEDKHKTIDGLEYKWCPDCNDWFPMDAEYFKVQPSKKDGYSDKCIVCQEKYNHENYMKNREAQIEKSKEYIRNNREKHNKANREAYQTNRWNFRETVRRSTQKRRDNGKYYYWLNNTEAGIASKNNQMKRNKEKKHVVYDIEWLNCKKYFANDYGEPCCAYCGLPINQHLIKYGGKIINGDFHKEHVVFNGKNDLSNCVPSCENCNNEKYDKTINEWYNINNPKFDRKKYLKIYKWIRWDYKKYIMPKRRYKNQRLIARLKEIKLNRNIKKV
jgi:hypothetical protein